MYESSLIDLTLRPLFMTLCKFILICLFFYEQSLLWQNEENVKAKAYHQNDFQNNLSFSLYKETKKK
jgi:hypothetical protein